MDLGTLIHAAVLEPLKPLGDIAVVSPYSDFRTKEARAWRDEQRELGKIIATQDEVDSAGACQAIFAEDYANQFKAKYDTEVAVFGKIGETEVKGLIDLVPEGLDCLIDLKTTGSIESADNLLRQIVSRGYHWQAALYLDLWNAASGEKRTRFVFCFMETEYPHETAWVEIQENLIDIGRAGYMNAIAKWQQCVATNHWPKQVEGVMELQTPVYLLK